MVEDKVYGFTDSNIIRTSVSRMLKKGSDPLTHLCVTNMVNLEENLNDGFHAGYLYAVDGPAGMGKTAFLLSLLKNIGITSVGPGILFSLDDSVEHVIRQMLVMISGPGILKCFEKGGCEADEEDFRNLREAEGILDGLGIYLADACGMSDPTDISYRLFHVRDEIHPTVVLIDGMERYLRSPAEAKSVARALSNCARNLGIAVVASCRLKRTVCKRRGHEPLPGDYYWYDLIREADVVMDLYRPAYYDPHASGNDARIRILKNGSGKCGTAFMHYDRDHNQWEN